MGTREDFEEQAGGEPITAARLCYPGGCDGVEASDRDGWYHPEWGPTVTWAEACAVFDQHGTVDYPDHDGDAPRAIAWTESRVIWNHEYDCMWSVVWLPRHPEP